MKCFLRELIFADKVVGHFAGTYFRGSTNFSKISKLQN